MKYDVIVVGGGPAGTTAARECAARGLNVLLLEKERYPRFKPCAGGITAAALELLGTDLPAHNIEAGCSVFQAHHRDTKIEIELDKDFMIVTSRAVFDHWLAELAQKAGAALRQGENVKSIESSENGVRVYTSAGRTYEGHVLVGADGVNGISSKYVRGPWKRGELSFCACAEVPAAGQMNLSRRAAEVYYGPEVLSYRWVFPKRETLSVGFGGWLHGQKNARKVLEEFIAFRGLKLEGPVKGHHIPLGGISRRVVADRVLLAGDAAGFADPLTGEGIRYAIHSGKLAAETLSRLFAEGLAPTAPNLYAYARACHRAFGRDLAAIYFLCRTVRRFPRLVDRFFDSKGLFYKFMEIITGKARYSDIYRPAAALKIIKALLVRGG